MKTSILNYFLFSIALVLAHFAAFQIDTKKITFPKNPECIRLPNGCKLKPYFSNYGSLLFNRFVCSSLEIKFDFDNRTLNKLKNCTLDRPSVYFRLVKSRILDASFDVTNATRFLAITNQFGFASIEFKKIIGFDLDLPETKHIQSNDGIQFVFYYSKLEFNSNGKQLTSCENHSFRSIFHLVLVNRVEFHKSIYPRDSVCPFVFANMTVETLVLGDLMDTFYKTNMLRFTNLSQHESDSIHTSIAYLAIQKVEKINLKADFLHPHVFRNLVYLQIFGEVTIIQTGLLKSFTQLKQIALGATCTRKLFTRGGIEWMRDLNPSVKIDTSHAIGDPAKIASTTITIYITSVYEETFGLKSSLWDLTTRNVFPDEDFCLYARFPFEQMIVLLFYHVDEYETCTFLWLAHIYDIYWPHLQQPMVSYMLMDVNFDRKMSDCGFEKRLKICNLSDYKHEAKSRKISTFYDKAESQVVFEFVLIILNPLVCVSGIVTNCLVILVVAKQSKELKENQYKFMQLNAISNSLMLFIQSIVMISDCQSFHGIFCSTIHWWPFSQYVRIVFGEYAFSCLSLFSNISFVGFSISRLSLIGSEQSKLVAYFSKVSVRKFLACSIVPCLALGIVRIFRFVPNTNRPEDNYPDPFAYLFNKISLSLVYVCLGFEILYGFVNYVVFLLLNFGIDVSLAVKLKQTIDHKKNSSISKSVKSSLVENKNKKPDDPVKRVITMVILNATLGILLKVPSVYGPIFDLAQMINYWRDSRYNPHHASFFLDISICWFDPACHSILRVAHLLYLSSFALNLAFYCKFDKKFRSAFEKTKLNYYQKTKTNKNEN